MGRPRRDRAGVLRDAGIAVLALLAILALTVSLLSARVEGMSMTPTLSAGDVLLVDRLTGILAMPERGDIVVIRLSDDLTAVKRVMALPGDVLEIDQGVVRIKPGGSGPWLRVDEPYLRGTWLSLSSCCDSSGRAVATASPVAVPTNQLFVLGDNRDVSVDSRTLGFISRDRIAGRVLVRYWPAGQARWSWPASVVSAP